MDKPDARVATFATPGVCDDLAINVDSDHLVAPLGQSSRKQALSTPYVKHAPAPVSSRTQYEIVIVNVVIPLVRFHRSPLSPMSRRPKEESGNSWKIHLVESHLRKSGERMGHPRYNC